MEGGEGGQGNSEERTGRCSSIPISITIGNPSPGNSHHGPFVVRAETSAINSSALNTEPITLPSILEFDACGAPSRINTDLLPAPSLPKNVTEGETLEATDYDGSKYVLTGTVKYKYYANYRRRLESFPKIFPSVKTPVELAYAGFFYHGEPDNVVCFCCGVGFKDWEPKDDPWRDHAANSPICLYMQVKGSQIVPQLMRTNASVTDLRTNSSTTFWPEVRQLTNADSSSSLVERKIHQALSGMGYSFEEIKLAIRCVQRKGIEIDPDVVANTILDMDQNKKDRDASIMVPGELPSINIRENELRVLNTQPPTLSGEISILECDTDWASGSFNPGPLPAELAHVQHSSANASLYLAVQSRLPVQCTSPNPSIDRAPDTLVLQVQPPAQSCMETMFTPVSADHGFSQQGQLLFLASADPASTSISQNHVGLFQGENQGHPGLLQQRNFSQPGKPMVPFQGCFHSKQPKNSVPNPREMAEQGFTYLGDGIFECNSCSVKLPTKQSPGTSDVLKNHHQLCRRRYNTQQYEMHCHGPQEQMPPKTPEHAAMLFATDEYGQKYSLHGPVKRPDYAEYIKRFNSFPIMPSSVPKTSKELASAGFYFLRELDQVACFSCGVGFQNWEPDDDRWEEHARQSRNCTYVTKVLRFRFVQQQPINGSSTPIQARTLATNGTSTSIQPRTLATNGTSTCIQPRTLATNGTSTSIQPRTLATNGSSASFLTRTLTTNGTSASIQPKTLATNGTSASIQPKTLATNGSIGNWQKLPIDSISHDVSNISLDAVPSMSREINYQAIADMGYQPDQIRRAITKLKGKKHIGVIDANSIVNEILKMDETKVTPRCFQCHREMRDGYTLLPCGHVAICLNCDVKNILICPVCAGRVTRCVVTYPAIMH